MNFRQSMALFACACGVLVSSGVEAAGTAAGTNVQNTAQVNYTLGGSPLTTASNSTTITVAEIVDVTVTLQSATRQVVPGTAQAALVLRVTNTGNSPQKFHLVGDSAITGDNFDPIPAAPFMYFDTDGSGDLSAADIAYVPGNNDPQIAADAAIVVLLVNSIPSTVSDAQRGRSRLTANAFVGTGAPGTIYAGQGIGGVDAVLGTTGGTANATGEYVVQSLAINAVKSQVVADQFGGTRPLPGARITYQIVITASGAGNAVGARFTDPIPANTSYVPNSLKLNGAALTDGTDADAGEYITAPAAQVRVALGDLTQASGAKTVEFAVTIN